MSAPRNGLSRGRRACDKSDTAFKLFGGYVDGFGLYVLGVVPIDKFSVFGKVGVVVVYRF